MSDSHDNLPRIGEAVELFNERGVAAVVHLGDVISPFVVRILKNLDAKLYGVFGNNDGERVGLAYFFNQGGAGNLRLVGDFFDKEFEGVRVAGVHGLPDDALKGLALSGKYGVVLHGHTHQARVEKVGEALLVNPGETCGYLTGKATVALVDLEKLDAELVTLHEGEALQG